MQENSVSTTKRQTQGQQNLYRLLRLQNRENHFLFRDKELITQFRVSYQHFPLETIPASDLLKTFWKFISTHYFKKIDQDELYRLTYIRSLFQLSALPEVPEYFTQNQGLNRFCQDLPHILDPQYLTQIFDRCQTDVEERIWLKQIYLKISESATPKKKKTKQIIKVPKPQPKKKSVGKIRNKKQRELMEKQNSLDEFIDSIDFRQRMDIEENLDQEKQDIDQQILRLEKLLEKNAQQNLESVSEIENKIFEEQQEYALKMDQVANKRDAMCIEGLVRSLQEKQIAESVSKIISCQRKEGQPKFQILYETALNIIPQLLNEHSLKKVNQLRQTSLLKFYKTGVKSTHSFICHNYAGFSDLSTNRMTASRHKDKDYIQVMKKMTAPQLDIKQNMSDFDICHHCKYMFPSALLVTCRFTSERPCMPKISESQTDFGEESGLQKGRISQRFVSKKKNCLTGYAKINDQYVCGRKFCKSCLKDTYGSDWMKRNNGICPFCEGICSCTRCLRNQKMNKLKAYFISLGGDINQLQAGGLVQKLPLKKDELICKIKQRSKKIVKIPKEVKVQPIAKPKTIQNYYPSSSSSSKRRKEKYVQIKQMVDEDLEKWSSTAQKELFSTTMGRRSNRRGGKVVYC